MMKTFVFWFRFVLKLKQGLRGFFHCKKVGYIDLDRNKKFIILLSLRSAHFRLFIFSYLLSEDHYLINHLNCRDFNGKISMPLVHSAAWWALSPFGFSYLYSVVARTRHEIGTGFE